MTIIIGSDVDGKRLKELIKAYLEDNDYDVLDVTEGKDLDFVDSTVSVAKEVQKVRRQSRYCYRCLWCR